MSTQSNSTVAQLPIESIRRSPTNPRKRFVEAHHLEMTASVMKHGVLQPVLVRPWPEEPGLFELVAGERRHRAAEAAQLVELPALVRDLTDDEVLHIQIIENLQRKDVHPLEEADGYKVLQERGHSAEQIAEEVSQTRSYVAQRLKLTSLIDSARELFFDGKLTAATALLIARLPAELQDKAAKEITAPWIDGEPRPLKTAAEHIQRNYMLRLDQAPFKTADAGLVPAAGACGPCPKRTGNQVDLFGDVKSKEVCTDLACYEKKRTAAAAQKRAEAEATGRTVIAGKEAKKVKPYQHGALVGGWVNLDEHCHDDPKHRTYRQILGAKGAKSAALLEDPHAGKLVDVMQKSDLKKALADKGIEARSTGAANPSQSAENAKKKAADAYRGELFRRVREKHDGYGLDEFDLKIVAVTFYRRLWNENQKRITKLYGWGSKPLTEAEFAKKVDEIEANARACPEGLGRLVMDIALIDESVAATYGPSKPELLEAVARERGIDPAAVRKQSDVDAKPKGKATPAPAAKKAAPAQKTPASPAPERKVVAKKVPAVKKPAAAKTTPPPASAKKVAARKPAPAKRTPTADEAGREAWPFPSTGRP